MPSSKIATCCYCGTKAALILRGNVRHELSCSSCGAPLHDLKMLRADHPEDGRTVRPSPIRPNVRPEQVTGYRQMPRKKIKRRKGLGRWLLEEAWDSIEDIFD